MQLRQVSFRIPDTKLEEFKLKCASEYVSLNHKLRELVYGYLSEVEEARIKQAS